MTLPLFPSASTTIGPSLASLVDTIGQLVKPTAKYDQALKAAFMEKPELMQKFVDVEKQNPGTLRAFGFGEGATDFLSGMKESIPSVRMGLGRELLQQEGTAGEGARRTAAQQEATGETPAQVAGAKLQEYMLGGGLDLMKNDPQAAEAAIREILKIGSKREVQTEADATALYETMGTDLANMSIPDIVQGLQSGKISAQQIGAAGLHPGVSSALKFAMDQYSKDREADLRTELAKIMATRPRTAGEVSMERTKLQGAIDMWKASKGAAPVGAFYEAMTGLPHPTNPATPEQFEAAQAWMKKAQVADLVAKKKALFDTIRPLYDQTVRKRNQPPLTTEQLQNNILRMNEALAAAGSPWRAELDVQSHWFGLRKNRQVVFRNRDANLISEEPPVFSDTSDPTMVSPQDNPPELDDAQRGLIRHLMGKTQTEQDAILERMRQEVEGDSTAMARLQQILDNLPAQ